MWPEKSVRHQDEVIAYTSVAKASLGKLVCLNVVKCAVVHYCDGKTDAAAGVMIDRELRLSPFVVIGELISHLRSSSLREGSSFLSTEDR